MSKTDETPEGNPQLPDAAEVEGSPKGSSASKEPPDIKQELKRRIYRRFGIAGLVVVFIAGIVFHCWWNWKTVRTRPGIHQIVSWLTLSGLPDADSERFTVALAHLENEIQRE